MLAICLIYFGPWDKIPFQLHRKQLSLRRHEITGPGPVPGQLQVQPVYGNNSIMAPALGVRGTLHLCLFHYFFVYQDKSLCIIAYIKKRKKNALVCQQYGSLNVYEINSVIHRVCYASVCYASVHPQLYSLFGVENIAHIWSIWVEFKMLAHDFTAPNRAV